MQWDRTWRANVVQLRVVVRLAHSSKDREQEAMTGVQWSCLENEVAEHERVCESCHSERCSRGAMDVQWIMRGSHTDLYCTTHEAQPYLNLFLSCFLEFTSRVMSS